LTLNSIPLKNFWLFRTAVKDFETFLPLYRLPPPLILSPPSFSFTHDASCPQSFFPLPRLLGTFLSLFLFSPYAYRRVPLHSLMQIFPVNVPTPVSSCCSPLPPSPLERSDTVRVFDAVLHHCLRFLLVSGLPLFVPMASRICESHRSLPPLFLVLSIPYLLSSYFFFRRNEFHRPPEHSPPPISDKLDSTHRLTLHFFLFFSVVFGPRHLVAKNFVCRFAPITL